MTPRQALRQWLDGFAACVRARDFARGRTFFHRRAHGFGSYADICWDLDDLVRRQWKQIWPNITGFRFDQRRLHYLVSPGGRLMGAMLPWRSTGFHPDGRRFLRNGRVTIILSRERDGRWVARHTHYSLNPGTSQTTVRRRRGWKCMATTAFSTSSGKSPSRKLPAAPGPLALSRPDQA